MAQSLKAFFQVLVPTLACLKLPSFFEKTQPNEPNHESSTSQTSSEQPILVRDKDIEASGSQVNSNGTTTNDLSVSSPLPTAATATQEPQEAPNPIAKIFQEQDLGKTMIALLMPITAATVSPDTKISVRQRSLILLSLSLGLLAIWNGIVLRQVLPRLAVVIEQAGAAFVLLAFYGLISSLLPDSLLWVPWLCFLLVLFPFFLSHRLLKLSR